MNNGNDPPARTNFLKIIINIYCILRGQIKGFNRSIATILCQVGSVNCRQLWTTTYYQPLIIPHNHSIIIISGNLFGLCLILCDSNGAV